MNKKQGKELKREPLTTKAEPKKEIKFQESPIERALKLSSDRLLAMAIRDTLTRSELH